MIICYVLINYQEPKKSLKIYFNLYNILMNCFQYELLNIKFLSVFTLKQIYGYFVNYEAYSQLDKA